MRTATWGHRLATMILSAAITVGVATVPARASSEPYATVITGIKPQGAALIASPRWNRVLVLGVADTTSYSRATTYAVIDTHHRALVATGTLGGSTAAAYAMDDRRGQAWLATMNTGYPNDTLSLWAIDVRTGHLTAYQRLLPHGTLQLLDLGVDATSGQLVFLSGTNGYGPWSVVRLDPTASVAQSPQSSVVGSQRTNGYLIMDNPRRLAIVVGVQGNDPAVTTLSAVDTRTDRPLWDHALTYRAEAVTLDGSGKRLWVVAPGGRVVAIAVASGATASAMPVTYQRATGMAFEGFALDTHANTGYVIWSEGYAQPCSIDAAHPGAGTQQLTPLFACNSAGQQVLGMVAGRLLVGDGASGHLSQVDPAQGHPVLSTITVPPTPSYPGTFTSVTISDGRQPLFAYVAEVAHQDDTTGASTAGAVVLVPIESVA